MGQTCPYKKKKVFQRTLSSKIQYKLLVKYQRKEPFTQEEEILSEDFAFGIRAHGVVDIMAGILHEMHKIILADRDDPKTSPRVRQRGLWVLRHAKHPAALALAADAMKDPSWRVRYLALKILGNFLGDFPAKAPDPTALKWVVGALVDCEPEVRQRAFEILVETPGQAIFSAVINALKSKDFDARFLALELLQDMPKACMTDSGFLRAYRRQKAQGKGFAATAEERSWLDLFRAIKMAYQVAMKGPLRLGATISQAAPDLSEDSRRLLLMLDNSSKAGKMWHRWMRTKEKHKKDRRFRRTWAEFFHFPVVEWQRDFEQVKLHVDKRYHRRLDAAWQRLTQIRKDVHRQDARVFRANLQKADRISSQQKTAEILEASA